MAETRITMHPYTLSDLPRIIEFRRTCTTSENSNDYPTVIDLHESLASSSSDMLTCLWEDQNGNIVTYGIVALNYCNLYFLIHPAAQSEQLATDIIDWGMQQLRGHNSCSVMDTPCRDTDMQRMAILEGSGFVRAEEQTLHMVRSLTEPIPTPSFPEGFTLRHVQGKDEVEAVVDLHQKAFGTEHMTVEHRLAMMSNPEYIQELDLLLVALDGTLEAFCYCTIPQEANQQQGRSEGEIAIIGTRPAYRNRGLGYAMLLAGLQQLKAYGIETATLGTTSENTHAQSVFYAAGFKVSYRSLWYSKKVYSQL